MTEWMLITGMAVLTFGTRYLPFGLADRLVIPPLLERALKFVPIAVLTAIIAQASLIRDNQLTLSWENHHAVAALVAFGIALFSKNLLVTVVVGLVVFWVINI